MILKQTPTSGIRRLDAHAESCTHRTAQKKFDANSELDGS